MSYQATSRAATEQHRERPNLWQVDQAGLPTHALRDAAYALIGRKLTGRAAIDARAWVQRRHTASHIEQLMRRLEALPDQPDGDRT